MYYSNLQRVHYKSYKDLLLALTLPIGGFHLKNNPAYFSPCSVSFVLSGEYIQYSPLINFRLIIPSNIHLQLIIPSNIHLQCLCSTKNEKKTTSRRQFGIENYFYSESLTQPRNVKNKYVILRHLGDMCLFTSALRASVNKSHIPSLPQNNLYLKSSFFRLV